MSRMRIALPAPFMRWIVRPARGWLEITELVSLRDSVACRRARALRPIDRPGTEPLNRVAQTVIIDSGRRRARGGFSRLRGRGRQATFLMKRGQRALAEGDFAHAPPAEMRIHPVHNHRGAVLRLK